MDTKQFSSISVLIPTYNRPIRALRAVESVLRQSLEPFEIIIGDNSSNMDLYYLLKKNDFLKEVRYYHHKENIGLLGNWNFLLDKAKGQYIKFLNDDDVLTEDSIAIVQACIGQCDPPLIVSRNSTLKRALQRILSTRRYSRSSLDKLRLFGYLDLGSPSEVCFKNCKLRFSDINYYSLDVEFYKKLVEEFGFFVVIPRRLCVIEKHENQEYNRGSLKIRIKNKVEVVDGGIFSRIYINITHRLSGRWILLLCAIFPFLLAHMFILLFYGKKINC